MSTPRPPSPARLIVGAFLRERDLLPELAERLATAFGPVELVSDWMPFDYTSYYEREMGTPLFRRMFSFARLVEQERLADIKLFTNALESEYRVDGRRRVNLDPGYLLRERFVLATGKNYSHRIYIGKGIYADLTLVFTGGEYRALDWTYPDYADPRMRAFLKTARTRYVEALRAAGVSPDTPKDPS